ncbi:MAG: hypothetical protein GY935_03205 [Gammaproteobacteria bacterium]|nr:hypothetical protein [Gammaproteobacteria bacterium]
MNSFSIRFLILLVAVIGLSACGFKLAGNASLPRELSTMHLSMNGLTEKQQTALRQRLTRAGVQFVNRDDAGAVSLTVSYKVLPNRRLVSSASNGKSVDRLARSLEFVLKSADGVLIVPKKTLLQQKDIQLDDDNLLASDREKEKVIEDLEQSLFNQLVRQLIRI